MKLMDEVAGIVAARHCNTNVVTVAVDAINFHRKIKKGERYPKQPRNAVAIRRVVGKPCYWCVAQATSGKDGCTLSFHSRKSVRAERNATLKWGFPHKDTS